MEFETKNKKYKELYNDYRKALNAYYAVVDNGYINFKQIKKDLQDFEKLKNLQENLIHYQNYNSILYF